MALKWFTLPEGGSYSVIDPDSIYKGRTYGSWICDWFNWFLCADADRRNSGPVVYLKSLGYPISTSEDSFNEGRASNVVSESTGISTPTDDPYYPRRYDNNPNIRIGRERLQINEGQAVLVPVIIAYYIASERFADLGLMRDYTVPTIDNGDNPPGSNQLTITGEPIKVPLDDFRILSPVFPAIIPDVEYGRSVKDILEMPEQPGNYPAIVEGYFVMLKFKVGNYFVHSWASGPRDRRGAYFSQLLYQIEVFPEKKPSHIVTEFQPARNAGIIQRLVFNKQKVGELGDDDAKKIKGMLKKVRGII